MERARQQIAWPLRYKLLALATLPLLLVLPAVVVLAINWSDRFSYQQLFLKVNTDLSVAHDVFERIRYDYLARLESLAESYRFRSDFNRDDHAPLQRQLDALREQAGLAHLALWSRDGEPLLPGQSGLMLATPLLDPALAGSGAFGIEVRGPEDLARVDPGLVGRVRLPLVATPRAVATPRTVEERAMWLRILYPVKDNQGRVVALLDGALLLNRNFDFVDAIRELVYGPGSLPEGGLGTVTVFLDDVRISTNVPIRPGERALGTRVSREVRDHVLEQGRTWVDRAFVVNDWYISAYEPILDVHGERVGMLYAGFLEAPFRRAHIDALEELLVVFLVVTGLAVVAAIIGAKAIFKPVEQMAAVVRATQAGEQRRIGEVVSRDEIGELARQFDAMLDLLQERNQQIRRAADELEAKVDERTRELRDKNLRLEQTIELLKRTREQLVTKEKLAAIGELTAGIAHEINNPTAVILGNLDIITAELGERVRPVDTEVGLIIEQIYRIRAIVNNLLQYSRPSAYAVSAPLIDPNSAVEDTLMLVRHALDKKQIAIRKRLRATRRVGINQQQLQQVLVNLVVNAVNAMAERGEIVLGSCDWKRRGVVLYVQDDGCGIPKERLGQIFDPFYTTSRQGTGLGLSVSYGIMRRYGGSISVRSRLGRGSIFFVWILTEPEYEDADDALLASIV